MIINILKFLAAFIFAEGFASFLFFSPLIHKVLDLAFFVLLGFVFFYFAISIIDVILTTYMHDELDGDEE